MDIDKSSSVYSSHGIHEIRPKVLFNKIEEVFNGQNVTFNVNIPSSAIGGLTLLESAVLVSLMKLLKPLEIFEFGTYFGATSCLLAENSLKKARITTIDLPRNCSSLACSSTEIREKYLFDADVNDQYLRNKFLESGAINIERADGYVKEKIRQINIDSRDIMPAECGWLSFYDYIFIDGGHDFETIKTDTKNAISMSSQDSIIIWHDYRSSIHEDVTRFIDDFSKDNSIIYVQSTMLAFMLKGKFKRIFC